MIKEEKSEEKIKIATAVARENLSCSRLPGTKGLLEKFQSIGRGNRKQAKAEIENVELVYPVKRSSNRKIYYIDVGEMPADKTKEYLNKIKNKFESKKIELAKDHWTPQTMALQGQVNQKDNGVYHVVDNSTKPLPMIYMAGRSLGKTTFMTNMIRKLVDEDKTMMTFDSEMSYDSEK